MQFSYRKLEWLEKEDIIKRMVSREFNRFLEYYSNAPEIEVPSDARGDRKGNTRGERSERSDRGGDRDKRGRKAEPGYTRLFINMGKTDNFYAAQVIDLINRQVRGKKVQIGRIDLMQNFSFFEVPEGQAHEVVSALNNAKVGPRKVVVEIAGEESGNDNGRRGGGRNASSSSRGGSRNGGYGEGNASGRGGRKPYASKEGGNDSASHAPKEARKGGKSAKPTREERGYSEARGPKKKEDWKKFFQDDNKGFRDEEPDFSEEGWAMRKPRNK